MAIGWLICLCQIIMHADLKKKEKNINELENEDKKLGKKEDFITLFHTDFTNCCAPIMCACQSFFLLHQLCFP